MRFMRIMRSPAVAAALLLTLFGSDSIASNILANPGFETGSLSPWVNSLDFCSGCTWSVTNTDAHAGGFSAVAHGNRLLTQAFGGIDTALITEASLWLKMPDSGIAAVRFDYSDSSFEENPVDVGPTWAQFDVTAFLHAGKQLVGFGVFGCSGCAGNSATFADDFVLDVVGQRVPMPATFSMLAMGAAGLGILRLKRRLGRRQ